jgi:uncharacterized cupredoxin-like copper-binding protein
MKKIMVLVVSVLFSTLVFANGTTDKAASSTVAVMNYGSNSFKVFYKAQKSGNVTVSIRNEKGEIVYSEKLLKIDGFIRPYNFENLPAGQYSIQIENQEGKQVEKVNFGAGKVEKIVTIAKVPSDEGRYLLSGFSKGADNISVHIYDAEGKTIYTEDRKVDGRFQQIYNLKNIKGSFSIEVSDDNGVLKSFGG